MSTRLDGSARGGAMKAIGVLVFFSGTFFLALAYTMALHGIYVDCLAGGGESAGCALRFYGEPTLGSALYGTLLGVAAIITYHIGLETFLRLRETAAPTMRI